MTRFAKLFAGMRREVLSPRGARAFAKGAAQEPALARHGSMEGVLAALSWKSGTEQGDSEPLVRALIAMQQRSPSSCWSSMLLLACYPMLGNLRTRVVSNEESPDELDQLVLTAFLYVVAEFSLTRYRDRTFMRLRQQTQRRLFAELADLRRVRDSVFILDPDQVDAIAITPWPEDLERRCQTPAFAEPDEMAEAVSVLVERAGDLLDGEGFDLVTSTVICGRGIQSFVQNAAPDLSPEEAGRRYQTAKRRHSRTLARLRDEIDPEPSPRWGTRTPLFTARDE